MARARAASSRRGALTPAEEAAAERERRLGVSVAELGVSVRTVNTLEAEGILTLRELLGRPYEDVKAINSLGRRAVAELKAALLSHGIVVPSWGMKKPRVRKKKGGTA